VTYDLTGLPPTPEEVESVSWPIPLPTRMRKLFEGYCPVLATGEHRAHYWLDVCPLRATRMACIWTISEVFWAYRDYVIRAYNQEQTL